MSVFVNRVGPARARGGRLLSAVALGLALVFHAAGPGRAQTGGASDSGRSAGYAELVASPAYRAGLAVWRAPRVKGACMSCHGPDFIDLARIGTAPRDITRRALADGTSRAEAAALVEAVAALRSALVLPVENPRSFRPFQPGGRVLPGASNIARDLAFGRELVKAMPTLGGGPITQLAAAQAARDEFLAVDFNRLRIGIPLPLWSADIDHGLREGTINDWVADLARVPVRQDDWIAVQDRYLADPSEANFWRLYFSVEPLTAPFDDGGEPAQPETVRRQHFAKLKFMTALVGQHGLRTQALGRPDFRRGAIAFAHLADADGPARAYWGQGASGDARRTLPQYLPNPWWELADTTRPGFRPEAATTGQPGNTGGDTRFIDRLRLLGYPKFVLDSIDPAQKADAALAEFRISWFALGTLLDPGLQRITASNSTLVGEYFQSEMSFADYFIHRMFFEGLRTTNRAFRAEANAGKLPAFELNFYYFDKYGRQMPTRWNTDRDGKVPLSIRTEQLALYRKLTANFYRMALLLYEDELVQGRIVPKGQSNDDESYRRIRDFLTYAGQPNLDADTALLRRVAARARVALGF